MSIIPVRPPIPTRRELRVVRVLGMQIEISHGMRRLIIATAAPWLIMWGMIFAYACLRLIDLNHQYDHALSLYYRPAFADDRATQVQAMTAAADEMVGLRRWTVWSVLAGLGAPLAAGLAFVGNRWVRDGFAKTRPT
jgi:hypothetical protein